MDSCTPTIITTDATMRGREIASMYSRSPWIPATRNAALAGYHSFSFPKPIFRVGLSRPIRSFSSCHLILVLRVPAYAGSQYTFEFRAENQPKISSAIRRCLTMCIPDIYRLSDLFLRFLVKT